jgi:hypothetical protein
MVGIEGVRFLQGGIHTAHRRHCQNRYRPLRQRGLGNDSVTSALEISLCQRVTRGLCLTHFATAGGSARSDSVGCVAGGKASRYPR